MLVEGLGFIGFVGGAMLITVCMILGFYKAQSYTPAHQAALAVLMERNDAVSQKMLLNMTCDVYVHNQDVAKETIKKQRRFLKLSQHVLTARQQLVLFDRLVGLETNLSQASKIKEIRSPAEIVDLAAKAITAGMGPTAPIMLFH